MNKSKILALSGVAILIFPSMTVAQIIPASDGTGTVVIPKSQTPNSQTFDIGGGSPSADRANLFHSFEQFNLNAGQTVNFISTPETQNILTRVKGRSISQIDGMIQVTGSNANLFLMNPAGIIFGSNTRLNVPASFFATTSTAIDIGNSINGIRFSRFNTFGPNNYSELVGSPRGFVFSGTSGTIINQGNLRITDGQTIGLVGNSVVNLGRLDPPNGNINIVMAPENGWVQIRQNGNILSLEVPAQTILQNPGLPIVDLPKILTGGNQEHATNVRVMENGTIQLTNSENVNRALPRGKTASETVKTDKNNDGVSFVPRVSGETLSRQSVRVINTSESALSKQPLSSNGSQNQFKDRRNIPKTESIPIESTNISTREHPSRGSQQTKYSRGIPGLANSHFESEPPSLRPPRPSDTDNILKIIPSPVTPLNNPEIRLSVEPKPSSARVSAIEERSPTVETGSESIMNYPVVRSLLSPQTQFPRAQILTEASIREVFSQIEAQTQQKPAAIYAIAHPDKLTDQIEGVELQNFASGLTLMLVLPDGKPIIKSIPDVKVSQLRRIAKEFYMEVSDPRTTGWPAARQLYQWLIAPLEADLKEAGINTCLLYTSDAADDP